MTKTLLHREKGHGKVCVCVCEDKKIGGIISAFLPCLISVRVVLCTFRSGYALEEGTRSTTHTEAKACTHLHTHTEREREDGKMYVRERKQNENDKKGLRKKHCEERKEKRHAKSMKNVEGEHMKSEREGNASHSRRWFLSEKQRPSFALCIFSRFVSLECTALPKRFRREEDAP